VPPLLGIARQTGQGDDGFRGYVLPYYNVFLKKRMVISRTPPPNRGKMRIMAFKKLSFFILSGSILIGRLPEANAQTTDVIVYQTSKQTYG
jgi:hypothetical protein